MDAIPKGLRHFAEGKKICFVIPAHWEAVMGGSQYQAKLLVEHLVSLGQHSIYYLARRVPKERVSRGYELIQIASPDGLRRFGECLDTLELLRLLEKISPDVIYQRVGCAYTGISAYYAKKRQKRCVWHVAHDQEVIPARWRLTRNIPFRYADKLMLEYGVRNATAIITQTQQQADYLRHYYGRKVDAIVPNYHPLPQRVGRKSDPVKTVVWVANLKPWKRPELFLRLAKDLSHREDVRFVMIGKPMGEPSWCRTIADGAARLENLRYLGEQPQEVVNEVLSEADIFVNTSVQEGFANTFIQSWLRGVPVVSLSVNPDRIFDSRSIGVCAGNYERLKEGVVELIEKKSLREKMGEQGRKYAEGVYADARNLELLTQLITTDDSDQLHSPI
jgi:glycosyltransferase involved in cell wall biosynthesis